VVVVAVAAAAAGAGAVVVVMMMFNQSARLTSPLSVERGMFLQ